MLLARYTNNKIVWNLEGSVPILKALESCNSRLCLFLTSGAYSRFLLISDHIQPLFSDQYLWEPSFSVRLVTCLRYALALNNSLTTMIVRKKPRRDPQRARLWFKDQQEFKCNLGPEGKGSNLRCCGVEWDIDTCEAGSEWHGWILGESRSQVAGR